MQYCRRSPYNNEILTPGNCYQHSAAVICKVQMTSGVSDWKSGSSDMLAWLGLIASIKFVCNVCKHTSEIIFAKSVSWGTCYNSWQNCCGWWRLSETEPEPFGTGQISGSNWGEVEEVMSNFNGVFSNGQVWTVIRDSLRAGHPVNRMAVISSFQVYVMSHLKASLTEFWSLLWQKEIHIMALYTWIQWWTQIRIGTIVY